MTNVAITALSTQADRLIHGASTATENTKIDKSAKDFEAILLGNWLEQAEQSFGSVPGGDEDDDDPGKQQYQGLAMESLGNAMTASGGIGIAKMIAKQLHRTEDARLSGNKQQISPVSPGSVSGHG